MAFNPIPKGIRKAWDAWNLRGFIILSLSLQTILILFAPFRKRTSNILLIFIVWSAYLLADWAAAFAVGLISNSQGDDSASADTTYLLTFWAPFLLVHLGGPDTITAFALEDNALWLRHLIGLVFQVFAAVYVFLQSLPENKILVAPTIVMLLAGLIKYAERTRALYLASLDKFKDSMLKDPDPGPNYAKLMDEYASKKEAKLPTRIEMIAEPNRESKVSTYEIPEGQLKDPDVVKHDYHFFETFKGLIVDLIFSFRERHESTQFFLARTPEDAFKVVLVELNFIYEVLYTKVVVVHSWLGSVFRFTAFSCEIVALILFWRLEKSGFHRFDVRITYTLLIGALTLDMIGTFMVIFSDWTVAIIKNSARRSKIVGKLDEVFGPILNYFLKLRDPSSAKCKIGGIDFEVSTTPVFYRRWAESIYAYNLIGVCIKKRPAKIEKPMGSCSRIFYEVFCFPFLLTGKVLSCISQAIRGLFTCCSLCSCSYLGTAFTFVFDSVGLLEIYDDMNYVARNPFVIQLWDFIFTELCDKSSIADDSETAKRICEAKGEWVLGDSNWDIDLKPLMKYVDAVEYDQSILLWHIATELCYNTEARGREDKDKELSKIMSDYMLYLLVKQQTLMSAVAGIGQIRFRDTQAEAEKFFDRRSITGRGSMEDACNTLLAVNTDVPPVAVKGDRSKSVLFDACMLAKELMKLNDESLKWKVMSKVWVELLSYAASHCRADTHAQLLSKGGELVTLVWLLMAHLGIGEQFQINEGHARAKLIVGK